MKRQPIEYEKIFANDESGRILSPKYTNSFYNSITKKQTTQLKKGKTLIDMSPVKTYRWPVGT